TESEFGYALVSLDDGGYAISGQTRSYGAGDWDVYLLITDQNGNLRQSKTFGRLMIESGYGIAKGDDNTLVITGWTQDPQTYQFDLFLLQTDIEGTELWSGAFNGSNEDIGYDVLVAQDGEFVVTGYRANYDDYEGERERGLWILKTGPQRFE
ncbi:MAG TPA: hypothetical protein VJA22_00570, partial [Patescibacteria group bacterium]|nr:hypothetical protein [Patescibacteria group bacterium]